MQAKLSGAEQQVQEDRKNKQAEQEDRRQELQKQEEARKLLQEELSQKQQLADTQHLQQVQDLEAKQTQLVSFLLPCRLKS